VSKILELIRFIGQRNWGRLLISVLAGLLAGVSYTAIAAIIDRGVRGDVSRPQLCWLLLGACTTYLITYMASTDAMLKLSQSALYRLRLELCRRLLGTSLETLQSLGTHRLLAIVTKDVDVLSDAYQTLLGLAINAVIICACMMYVGWLYWPLLVVFSILLVFGIGVTDLLRRWPMRDVKEVRDHLDGLYGKLRNLIEGRRELQLNKLRGHRYIEQVIASQAEHVRRGQVRGFVRFALVMNLGELIYFGSIGVLLFALPYWLTLPSGALATTVIILLFASQPIGAALHALPAIGQARAALDKIQKLEEGLPEGSPQTEASFISSNMFRLELRGIKHHYTADQDRHFVLGPLDLNIHGGEILFVVGGNGSGKSTLAMLILGLYRADAGEIRLNGSLLVESNREQYRQNFSAVLADFYLFEEVCGEDNLYISERVRGYLKMLRIDHKVTFESGKYSTLELSSGQRKRLALVSAYTEDRPVYLFDEWAADQDPEFKRIFYTTLLPELKAAGKAVIVITHDDAYFEYADRLIRINEGQIEADTPMRNVLSAERL
jgi:putative ATP-binding cassette transporter